jgi:hypothetical protein
MDPITLGGIGLTVTLLTEMTKRVTGNRKGRIVSAYAVIWSVTGVLIWYISQPVLPGRTELFTGFSATVVIAATAMGIYETIKSQYDARQGIGVRRVPS